MEGLSEVPKQGILGILLVVAIGAIPTSTVMASGFKKNVKNCRTTASPTGRK